MGTRPGICALCRQQRELQDGHFLAAGFYSIVRRMPGAGGTVLVAPGASVLTDAQARAHILCSSCEQTFNRSGEDWVIDNAWHNPGDFPLRVNLDRIGPIVDEKTYRGYQVTPECGVDTAKLAYFALSVVWRASVHDWRLGRAQPKRIVLGPYQESLRRFLNGETEQPREVCVVPTISMTDDEKHNRVLLFPWRSHRTNDYIGYQFVVPGISFFVMVGGSIPAHLRSLCVTQSGYILQTSQREEQLVGWALKLLAKAPRRGKFARRSRT